MFVVSDEVAVHGRRGAELHVGAEVVAARLAELAVAARHARLDGHAVTYHQVLHFGSHLTKTNLIKVMLPFSSNQKNFARKYLFFSHFALRVLMGIATLSFFVFLDET